MVCTFFLKQFLYLFKPPIDFSIEGSCPDKPFEQPFMQI